MCQNCLCYIVYDQIGLEWYTQYCFMRNAFINTVFKFSVDLRKKPSTQSFSTEKNHTVFCKTILTVSCMLSCDQLVLKVLYFSDN